MLTPKRGNCTGATGVVDADRGCRAAVFAGFASARPPFQENRRCPATSRSEVVRLRCGGGLQRAALEGAQPHTTVPPAVVGEADEGRELVPPANAHRQNLVRAALKQRRGLGTPRERTLAAERQRRWIDAQRRC